MTTRTYLDFNATAPLRPEAPAAMLAAMNLTGNPSSIHAEGRAARAVVERAREQVAELVGAEPQNVIFTSGATEAAAMALTPDWQGRRLQRLLVSAIEHPCVLAGGRFSPEAVSRIPVTGAGVVDVGGLRKLIQVETLVAVMAANNETGIIQPVSEAARIVHEAGSLLVCDAVQAAGRIAVDIKSLGADALLLSAHKIGGPKGVGALVLANEAVSPTPLLTGGGQERRQRAGTENVAGIAGFGAAATAAMAELDQSTRIARLRDRLEELLGVRHQAVSDTVAARLPNTALLVMPGVSAQMLVMQLDLAGFAVSAGAACSSGKVTRSPVLDAMGLSPDIASGAVRVSLGGTTTGEDIERFAAAWSAIRSIYALRANPRAKPVSVGVTHARRS